MSNYSLSFTDLQKTADDDPEMKTNSIVSELVQAGIASGNIKVADRNDTLDLSESSQLARKRHDELLRQVEAKRRARNITVPTNDLLVRKRLRQLSHPITLFGERAPSRRERLRSIMARLAVEHSHLLQKTPDEDDNKKKEEIEERKAYLLEGDEVLLKVRLDVLSYSIPRAQDRIERQKRKRLNPLPGEEEEEVKEIHDLEDKLKHYTNHSSEIGDIRPISSCHFAPNSKLLATASWSGMCKVWSVPESKCHFWLRDFNSRVTDINFHPLSTISQSRNSVNLATCDVNNFVRLWSFPTSEQFTEIKNKIDKENDDMEDVEMKDAENQLFMKEKDKDKVPILDPLATLTGHTDRCTRLAFHPSGRFLGSASYDGSWRLWDVDREISVLTQSGHSRGVYAIAFQCDGSIVATGDLGGIGRLWDLRTGKALMALRGHSKQILTADFAPNGYILATGSDDHTVRIWDLRKKMSIYTIPAHSKLISNVRFQPERGHFLVTSSYDKTAKIWSASDFALVRTLAGHEGRVMRVDVSPDSELIATASFDRTWKLWSHES